MVDCCENGSKLITAVVSGLAEEMFASQEWSCSTDLVTSLVGYLFVCIVCHLAHRATVATDYIVLVQSITASAGAQLTTKRETSRALPCGSQVSLKNPAYETTDHLMFFRPCIIG